MTWSVNTRGKEGTFYQYSSDGGEKWTHPVRVGKADKGRVFAGDSTLHFVSIYGGHDYRSHDHGRAWAERDPLIPLVPGGFTKFDGCCFGDTLMLAYLDNDSRNSVVRMNVARFVGDRELDRETIGRIPYIRFNLHEPRLWDDGRRMWLVATVSSSVHSRNATSHHTSIHLWSSSDRGSHWTGIPVPKLKEGPEYPRPTIAWAAPISSLRLALVWRGIEIQRQESADWAAERRISESQPPSFGLGPDRTFDSAIRGDLTALAWTDHRYDSDLWDWIGFFTHPNDWLNMGGMSFPNNSVLVAFDRGNHAAPRLIRLTNVPSHALNVRVEIRGDELLVLWSALVGRDFDAQTRAQKRPRVYFARVSLSGVAAN